MSKESEEAKDGCFIVVLMFIIMPFSMMYNAYALQLGFKWIISDALNIGIPNLISLMAIISTINFYIKKKDKVKDTKSNWETFGGHLGEAVLIPSFYILVMFILSKFL